MSIYFVVNNLSFALGLLGAVSMLMAAWLTYDTYSISKEGKILARTLGFVLCATWFITATIGVGNDALLFIGFTLFIIGLVCILISFIVRQKLAMPAILIIPSFVAFEGSLLSVSAILLLAIAFVSHRESRLEFNKTWTSFSVAFVLLGAGALLSIFAKGNETSYFAIAQMALELSGFIFLSMWVWQFLALRIRESLIIIFISAALFLSTVVTLAFSTILITQIADQTKTSLLTDARVLDLNINALEQQSLAQAQLFAGDARLEQAVAAHDFEVLAMLSENFMGQYSLGFLTVTDAQGTVLLRAHALSRRDDSLAGERAFEEARVGTAFVTIENSPVEKLSIRAGAPVMKSGKVVGVVIAGYPLDNALVDGIKRVTGLEMFIYENATSVAATAFARDGYTRLTGLPLRDASVQNAVLESGESVTAQTNLFGQTFLASFIPLSNGDEKIIGMISAAKPQQDILDIVNATNRLTLITVILIMIILVYPIYRFTKRLTEQA